jgi:hypothetical protein
VQLTGTNRLIGLIAPIAHAHPRANPLAPPARCAPRPTPACPGSAILGSPRRTRQNRRSPRSALRAAVAPRKRAERPRGKSLPARPPRGRAAPSCLSFAGLVALARSLNPIPSRTRPLNSSAPMVLCLKTWESRSSPGLQRTAGHQAPHHRWRPQPDATPPRPRKTRFEPSSSQPQRRHTGTISRRGVEQPGSSSGS